MKGMIIICTSRLRRIDTPAKSCHCVKVTTNNYLSYIKIKNTCTFLANYDRKVCDVGQAKLKEKKEKG